ncbi:GntR family transcriptional regulator [Paramesorhizobium deserti]|uniref:GntR family transcriptional regulator n=1 Tax=Paramesorhizobium deserti TaxID=1494590 RepID=UPI001FCD3738|nr:GntR family transcriptional regulator [Paramesorhizobium deserti]
MGDRQRRSDRTNRVNFFQLAYERIEDLIVKCELLPGSELSMLDLQNLTGLGRTPIHHAVNRLAHDTLIVVRPRHGLRIAPIDLSRERLLLSLRKDVERFVIELAAQRSSASHRNQMLHLIRALRERRSEMEINEFNEIDRRIDTLMMTAAGEPFVEHTLRPLHTIFRRTGWLYHRQMPGSADLKSTIDVHLAVLEAVSNRHVEAALQASDALIAFVDDMFDDLEARIDPSLLDASIQPLSDPHRD